MNAEGRVQTMAAALKPPAQAKEDWKIFRALSEVLGKKLPFDTLAQLRDTMVLAAPKAGKMSAGKITSKPFVPSITEYYLAKPVFEAEQKLWLICRLNRVSLSLGRPHNGAAGNTYFGGIVTEGRTCWALFWLVLFTLMIAVPVLIRYGDANNGWSAKFWAGCTCATGRCTRGLLDCCNRLLMRLS